MNDWMATSQPSVARLCASFGQPSIGKDVLERLVLEGTFALPKETGYLNALAMNERLGLRPLLARTCCEYARYQLASGRAAARRSGRELQRRAIALCETLHLPRRAAIARGLG